MEDQRLTVEAFGRACGADQLGSEHVTARRRDIAREGDEARLVDAAGVNAGYDQHRRTGRARRTIDPRAQRTVAANSGSDYGSRRR